MSTTESPGKPLDEAVAREAITSARKTGAALHIVHVGSSGLSDVPEVLRPYMGGLEKVGA